jgi:basic membrane protein A and related proteins
MRITVFFVGEVHDDGFNASALDGALRAKNAGIAKISVIDGVPYKEDVIRTRLAQAMPGCDGLVFIGGQGNSATPEIAGLYPDKRFAIVQGHRTGPNLASYDVLQEETAFLAGALAALITKTGVVGHLSGHRVRPGLKGRAAFAAGVAYIDPDIELLTGFCGTQDDNAVSRAWADAEISAGADVIFTMLNAARRGAIDACRAGGAMQIGNALDWVARDEEVFIASAMARIDLGVERAIHDIVAGQIPPEVVELGLADGDYGKLTLGKAVAPDIRLRINQIALMVRDNQIDIPDTYKGPEFQPETGLCIATA